MIEFYRDVLDGPIYWIVAIISIIAIIVIIGYILDKQQKAKLHKESQIKYTNNMFEQSMNEMVNNNNEVQQDIQTINNNYNAGLKPNYDPDLSLNNNEYYANANSYNNINIPSQPEKEYNSNEVMNFNNMNYDNSEPLANINNQEQNNIYNQNINNINNTFMQNTQVENNIIKSDDDAEFL